MKRISLIAVSFLTSSLPACSGSDTNSGGTEQPHNDFADAGADYGGSVDVPDDPPLDAGPPVHFVPWPATGEPCAAPAVTAEPAPLTTPTRLVAGDAVPLGVTTDGYVIYRKYPMFQAAKIGSSDPPVDLSATPGAVLVRGRVVFHWENVDYTTNTGNLMMFSGPACGRTLGTTPLDEDFFAASDDGSLVLYATNATATTMDIMIASRDLVHQQTLIAGAGRGSETTCRPKYGFAGNRLIVAYCTEGSMGAIVQMYELEEDTWRGIEIANDATTTWAADVTGERMVFVTGGSQARLWEDGQVTTIDEGVTSVYMLPDGSALLYAVGDQLRRTALPDVVPIPIVTREFRNLAAWSATFDRVLYSANVVYEPVEGRDLFVSPTTEFTAIPPVLVTEPVARLSRSAFTSDGKYALYLIGSDDRAAGTLYVRPVSGAESRMFEGVDTALAVRDDLIVFSTDRSDPDAYPIVANLQALRAAGGMPAIIQSNIVDGRSIYATHDGQSVVYGRAAGTDPSSDVQGVWVHPLP